MITSGWLSVLILIEVCAKSALCNTHSAINLRTHIELAPKHLQKRAFRNYVVAKGARAVKKLLKDAKHVYNNGWDNIYTKPGGYEEALADFRSIKPKVTKERKRNGLKVGKFANVTLKLVNDNGVPKLTISELKYFNGQFKDPPIDYTIVYEQAHH